MKKGEKMKRTAILTALVLTLVIGSPLAAIAGSDAPVATRIIESGKLRVGMTGTQPPYTVVSKTGEVIGYEVDIATLRRFLPMAGFWLPVGIMGVSVFPAPSCTILPQGTGLLPAT